MNAHIEILVNRLIREAREKKGRVQMRLRNLNTENFAPIRGRILPNGRISPLWVFYNRAVENHKNLTAQIRAVIRGCNAKN